MLHVHLPLGVCYFLEDIIQAHFGTTAPVNGGCELVHIPKAFASAIGPGGGTEG